MSSHVRTGDGLRASEPHAPGGTMTPVLEAATRQLLKSMTSAAALEFLNAHFGLPVPLSYETVDRVRRKMAGRGEAYAVPMANYEPIAVAEPMDLVAAKRGCADLRRAIARYHAKHGPKEARARWLEVAAQ